MATTPPATLPATRPAPAPSSRRRAPRARSSPQATRPGRPRSSTRWRTNCMRRYGIQIGDSNADTGTLSASTMPGRTISRRRMPCRRTAARPPSREERARGGELHRERLLVCGLLVGLVLLHVLVRHASCLSQLTVITVVSTMLQTPNSARVRYAATTSRRSSDSPARPTWKPELISVPRAACWRRCAPSSAPKRSALAVAESPPLRACSPCRHGLPSHRTPDGRKVPGGAPGLAGYMRRARTVQYWCPRSPRARAPGRPRRRPRAGPRAPPREPIQAGLRCPRGARRQAPAARSRSGWFRRWMRRSVDTWNAAQPPGRSTRPMSRTYQRDRRVRDVLEDDQRRARPRSRYRSVQRATVAVDPVHVLELGVCSAPGWSISSETSIASTRAARPPRRARQAPEAAADVHDHVVRLDRDASDLERSPSASSPPPRSAPRPARRSPAGCPRSRTRPRGPSRPSSAACPCPSSSAEQGKRKRPRRAPPARASTASAYLSAQWQGAPRWCRRASSARLESSRCARSPRSACSARTSTAPRTRSGATPTRRTCIAW